MTEDETNDTINNAIDNSITIGQHLKFERERKEISLKIVNQHTKISLTMLSYLEDEDYEKLPDLAYVRGFVKNYSNCCQK